MARKPLRPLIRSGGFYPSRKWTPLVYAGGYTTANGGEEPAPPPIEKTVTGNPIHILDALAKPVQALSVKLEPIQDLNGYDNPWPAGGGVNKLDLSQATSNTGYGITGSVSGDVVSISGTWAGNSAGGAFRILRNISVSSTESLSVKAFLISGTDISSSFRLSDNNTTLVIQTIAIEPDTPVSASYRIIAYEGDTAPASYSPYSNLCPISGHTSADVTRTGKNLFRLVEAEAIKSGYDYYIPNPIPTAGSYKLTCQNSFGGSSLLGCAVVFRDSVGGTNIGAYYAGYNFGNTDREGVTTTITAEQANAQYIVFLARSSGLTFSGLSDAQIQIELGSTATAYAPYVGTTYPIPLGNTVYGGTIDVVTGVVTVDRAMVDLGTLSYRYVDTTDNTYFVSTTSLSPQSATWWGTTSLPNALCSQYKPAKWNDIRTQVSDNSISSYGTSVRVSDSKYNDVDTFKTAMSGVQLVYELATPQTIQLTPTQVELLLGENNIFSDGEMTLVYLADGNASDEEALNILLGGRYVNNHEADEPTDREALNIILGGNER